MTAARPGQAAYEAYVMAAPDDMNFPVPDSLDAWERDAWEAAAQAGYEQRCQNDAAAREPHAAPSHSLLALVDAHFIGNGPHPLQLVCMTEDAHDAECDEMIAEVEPGTEWDELERLIARHAAERHAAREPHAAAGQSWTDSLPSRHVDEPVRVIEKPAPEPPCMTPAVARPYPGSTLVLAVGADTSDEDVAGAVEALTVATEGDGVTVVTLRGVDALRTWEPQPAPGLAALRQAAARELVTAADRDQLSAELGKLKQLLDDFTHAVIDLDDGARLVGTDRLAKAAHAVREKAGLPVIDQFSHPAGPPA